jgi:hypothetical protein
MPFTVNEDGHVVWANSNRRVSAVELTTFDEQQKSQFGALCLTTFPPREVGEFRRS